MLPVSAAEAEASAEAMDEVQERLAAQGAEIERLGGDTTRLAKIVDVIDEWSNPLIPKRPDTSGNALKLMNSAKVKKKDLAAERRRKRWDESAKYCA